MTMLKAALALLKVVQGLLSWVERNNLEDAVIANQTLKSLRETDALIEKALAAKNDAYNAPIDGDGDGVPDDDGYRID